MVDYELRIFDEQSSGARSIQRFPAVPREIRVLGSAKKIYGGAFSGHADAFREEEHKIIMCFIETASSFEISVGRDVDVNRRRLFRHADKIMVQIRHLFENEVDMYLQHIAGVMSTSSTPLRWNRNTNNCQHFSENLLRPLDTSALFHKIPSNYFSDEDVKRKKKWPILRYLLSFGHAIDTPMALLSPQDRSLIWIFYHHKRDEHDIVEMGEILRSKPCWAPTDAWDVLCDEHVPANETTVATTNRLSLSDALWSLPRDTLSIIQTQLMRSWAKHSSNEGRPLSPKQWVLNRLRTLHQLDVFASLCSSFAMATIMERATRPKLNLLSYGLDANRFGTLYVS